MNLATGTVLQNGKYVVEAILGQGGFGITYRAHHAYFDQPVVIKVLHENLRRHADFAQFQQQFIAEARRVARCQHPNIVRVFDFFEEGSLSFIVMDYIPGDTLADIVQSEGALPEAKAIHYIRQIGAALNVVHQAGLLHRDVKPHNIIRREHTDFVVLIDFGIAREFTPGVTQTHTGMLSAGYAPIEQYLPQGKRTPALDIYALAATLYSLVTGQAPIAAPLRDRIPLLDMRQSQPHLSTAVEQAILRGMEMEAEARPQTVAEWFALLPNSNFVTPASETAHASKLPPAPPSTNSQPQPIPATVTSATLPVVPRHSPTPAAVATPVTPPTSATAVASHEAAATPAPSRKAPPPKPAPAHSPFPKALLGAAAIATCVGVAFGLVLRISGGQAGPTFLQNDQSFPERAWPGQEVPTSVPPDVPVERGAPQDNAAPPPEQSESTADEAPPEPIESPLDLAPTPSLPPDVEVAPSPVEVDPAPNPVPDPSPVPAPVEASPIPAPEPAVEPEPQPPANNPEPAPEPEPPSDNSAAPASSFAPPAAPEPPAPSP
ncbi:serine/threonine-protein kinase [Trichocoleus sp. FACHB-262]|uniref:serine/threonine protein kinase n=1 Tax=Trichocoleus sp. FACHB-262 TaxID=2692869 RepID=UPI001682D0EB|nr:serine/threonine-protein kinase [Trichocoleus sp. FACHB-262]MBD2122181.1 protein kinase [Trichocoleus sp. FACHB-262]